MHRMQIYGIRMFSQWNKKGGYKDSVYDLTYN